MSVQESSALYALLKSKDWSKAEQLISSDPSVANERWDDFDIVVGHGGLIKPAVGHGGLMPLHWAIMEDSLPLAVLLALLAAAPGAASDCDNYHGVTALHIAAEAPFSRSDDDCCALIEKLVALDSRAIAQPARSDEATPLLKASFMVSRGQKIGARVVRMLLHACPEAARVQNKFGVLPLQMLVGVDVWEEDEMRLAREVLQACPAAISAETEGGWTALHFACMNRTYKSGARGFRIWRPANSIESALWLLLEYPRAAVREGVANASTMPAFVADDRRQTRSDAAKIERWRSGSTWKAYGFAPAIMLMDDNTGFPFLDSTPLRMFQALVYAMNEAVSPFEFVQWEFNDNVEVFLERTNIFGGGWRNYGGVKNKTAKRAFLRKCGGLVAAYQTDTDYAKSGTLALLLCLGAAREQTRPRCPMARSGFCEQGGLFTTEFVKSVRSYLAPSFEVLTHALANLFFEKIMGPVAEADGESDGDGAPSSPSQSDRCCVRTLLDGSWARDTRP